MKRLAILVSGGGTNMEAIAAACREGGVLAGLVEPAVVVSNKAGVGALERARRLGVPSEVVPHARFASREEHERALLGVLRARSVNLVALAGYMRILTPAFLEGAPGPVLNIHPVPTHRYQGPAGYEDLWEHRTRYDANYPTVHLVDVGVDTGQVVLFGLPYRIAEADSFEELRDRGLAEEHQLYPEAIRFLTLSPHLVFQDADASSVELSGISHLSLDVLEAGGEAKKSPGSRIVCLAQRDWQGTGYRIVVEGPGLEREAKLGWLAGTERAAFTRLLVDLLSLSRDLPVEFLYEGIPIDLTDTRPEAPRSSS
jgi:phosphoribosylglycinamide formyltransferase 1